MDEKSQNIFMVIERNDFLYGQGIMDRIVYKIQLNVFFVLLEKYCYYLVFVV